MIEAAKPVADRGRDMQDIFEGKDLAVGSALADAYEELDGSDAETSRGGVSWKGMVGCECGAVGGEVCATVTIIQSKQGGGESCGWAGRCVQAWC